MEMKITEKPDPDFTAFSEMFIHPDPPPAPTANPHKNTWSACRPHCNTIPAMTTTQTQGSYVAQSCMGAPRQFRTLLRTRIRITKTIRSNSTGTGNGNSGYVTGVAGGGPAGGACARCSKDAHKGRHTIFGRERARAHACTKFNLIKHSLPAFEFVCVCL